MLDSMLKEPCHDPPPLASSVNYPMNKTFIHTNFTSHVHTTSSPLSSHTTRSFKLQLNHWTMHLYMLNPEVCRSPIAKCAEAHAVRRYNCNLGECLFPQSIYIGAVLAAAIGQGGDRCPNKNNSYLWVQECQLTANTAPYSHEHGGYLQLAVQNSLSLQKLVGISSAPPPLVSQGRLSRITPTYLPLSLSSSLSLFLPILSS